MIFQLAPLGPRTTDDELNALFEEIGKIEDMDPEMTQDLLEFLNSEEDDEDYDDEPMEEDLMQYSAVGGAEPEEAMALDEVQQLPEEVDMDEIER